MAYNPYSGQAPQQMQQAPQQANSAYGQNPLAQQEQGPKTFSLPTWLAWVLGLGFVIFAAWLVWFLYF